MLTIDTNILTRYLLNDDPNQAQLAMLLISNRNCYVPITVILELAWVLKSEKLPKKIIINEILRLLSLPTIFTHYQPQITQAMLWANEGMDIADSLHLMIATIENQLPLTTFDKKFINHSINNIDTPNCINIIDLVKQ